MKNAQYIQGVTALVALICLAIGWIQPFSPEVNNFFYRRIFYFVVGVSFIFQAQMLANRNFIYPMYLAAALCIIGAFLPYDSRFQSIKTVGLLAGVIISLFNRPKMSQQ